MEQSQTITAAEFVAHLKCPTKAVLLARGEKVTDTSFGDIGRIISAGYKAKIRDVAFIQFQALTRDPKATMTTDGQPIYVDSETASCLIGPSAAVQGVAPTKTEPKKSCIPALHLVWDKVEQSDLLLVSFCALAIGQVTGAEIPGIGRIIFRDAERVKTVRVPDFLGKTRQVIEAIAKNRKADPPPVVLNKHCPVCDFQLRCRNVAINLEELSLLGMMSGKERAKCSTKGITTITQLSYTYRPRRRKRVKSTAISRPQPTPKHDHRLKALAVKKSQIHVVGSPVLSLDGTPVFIDVEGTLGSDFYYLIGLRYQKQGRVVELSFWADRSEDEADIWRECFRILRQIDNPRLIHYGSYESRFLKLMRARWKPTGQDALFLENIIDSSTNLLSILYGQIYFPTYANSLKEIARWLGFEWTWPQASGAGAVLLRRAWELTGEDRFRQQLLAYNIEDCRAVEVVANAIKLICDKDEQYHTSKCKAINVSTLEVGFQRTFGKFSSVLPEFEKINAAAYWDYQRSKVYLRTNKLIHRSLRKTAKPLSKVVVEKEVTVDDRPERCHKCGSPKIWIAVRVSNVVFDLKFTRRGVKRWAIRYRYNNYRCGTCQAQMTPYVAESKYGQHLRAYISYLLIEVRLSHEMIRHHMATVFDLPIPGTTANDIKRMMAQKYEPTYRGILASITNGPVIHADETKGVVYGGGHYVWIFANLTSVAYAYSPSREASVLNEVLAGFNGVLVSDFYGGYDSLPCRQQKCLIHLMRDINEDLLKHPFNDELRFIADKFGTLLRDIIDTIDKHGLRKYFLNKHKRAAEQFLADVASVKCSTEIVTALKKRVEKNRDRLFTFLDHDGVPWNNNNAEHAVRAFTRLRNGMASSTAKGTTDYCILLSLQQTLRYRGINFLEFLRSDRIEID
jgi:predicted RecB family nuclease